MKRSIREPWRGEWDGYRSLLTDADLTIDGVAPDTGGLFMVAVEADGTVVGGVGAEGAGPEVLLRSLVVSPAVRGGGLGSALLAAMETTISEKGARAIYLLTATAEEFFAARGYGRLSRDAAPPRIRQSREFAVLCPASAVLMVRHVGAGGMNARDGATH